ncbi:MAG: AsmA-like C-terminal region-containing protein [Bacteroidales bacterium]|nr:AsmA-like C-terminal region-containing protein [Bacteroidales bacterium]
MNVKHIRKNKIRNIGKYFFITSLILLAVLIAGFWVFRDQIKQILLSAVNKELNITIQAQQIETNVWQHFPFVSLDMESMKSGLDKGSEPFIKARQFSILFNPIDVLMGSYNLKRLALRDAEIMLDEQVFAGYEGAAKQQGKNILVNLRYIDLQNVLITYLDKDQPALNILCKDVLLTGKIEPGEGTIKLVGNVVPESLPHGLFFLNNMQFFADMEVKMTEGFKRFRIKAEELRAGDFSARATARIKPSAYKITIEGERQAWKNYFELMPPTVQDIFKPYRIKGPSKVKAEFSGSSHNQGLEEVQVIFAINRARISGGKLPQQLENVSLKGSYSETFINRQSRPVIDIPSFTASFGESDLNGEIRITGFSNPLIGLKVHGEGKTSDIAAFFVPGAFENIRGTYIIDVASQFLYDAAEGVKASDLIHGNTSGKLNILNGSFGIKGHPLDFSGINTLASLDNNNLDITEFEAKVAGMGISAKGRLKNALAFTLVDDEKLELVADVKAGKITWDKFLDFTRDSKTGRKFSMPGWFLGDVDLAIDEMYFGKFRADEVKANIRFRDKAMRVDKLVMNTMNGTVKGGGSINTRQEEIISTSSHAVFQQVDLHQLFYQFGDFNQESLTHKNLKGTVDARVDFYANWSPTLEIKPASVITKADLSVTGGELIKYSPLQYLSKYFPKSNLDRVRFSTLENTVHIYNKVVSIPSMSVHSSTADFNVRGTHGFDNTIDYRFRVLLSEILQPGKERKEISKFGRIEDDGLGRTKVFLRLSGTVDQPYLKYDKEGLKQKIAEDIKEEKRDIKEAFNKEFEWITGDSATRAKRQNEREKRQKQEKGEFIINWGKDDKKKMD